MKATEPKNIKRQLIMTFAGLLFIIFILQVVMLFTVNTVEKFNVTSRGTLFLLKEQTLQIQQFERATYHAVAALAMSDWSRLLNQREESEEIIEAIEHSFDILMDEHDHETEGHDHYKNLEMIEDEELIKKIQRNRLIWRELKRTAVVILRSSNWEIKGNMSLLKFQKNAEELKKAQAEILYEWSKIVDSQMDRLRTVQFYILFFVFVFIFLMAGFVHRKTIIPLDDSIKHLNQSRHELTERNEELNNLLDQLRTNEAKLQESNKQMTANEQQLKKANQELKANEAKLIATNKEMELFYDAAVDREKKIIELKQEANSLFKELGRSEPYDLSFLSDEVDELDENQT